MSAPDILEDLKPFFDKEITETDQVAVDQLADIFERDMIDVTIPMGDITLVVKRHKYSKADKDGLPEYFNGYYERFIHIITRTENGTRGFDSKRANRIHWIKPILENSEDPRITCFAFVEANGAVRNYYWYRAKMYMVIVENIDVECTLITGFCVDPKHKDYYQHKYTNRIK